MKKLLLTLSLLTTMFFVGDTVAFPPTGGGCTKDCTFTGDITLSGSGERVAGANAYIDFDDLDAGGEVGRIVIGSTEAGGNNNQLKFDFETATDGNIWIWGDVSPTEISWVNTFHDMSGTLNLTTPEALHITATAVDGARYGIDLELTSSNSTANSSTFKGINNKLTIADIDHGAGVEQFWGLYNEIKIYGDGGDVFDKVFGSQFNLWWAEQTNTDDLTVTSAFGYDVSLIITALDDTTVLTMTNYAAFSSNGFPLGSLGAIVGTDWRHFVANDLAMDGTITCSTCEANNAVENQYGVHIKDMAEGDQNYGVVLDDGADCVWMDGVTGTAICSETVTLSAANINAMNTPVTVVAKRAGAILEFVGATLVYTDATDYAACDTAFVFEYETSATAVSATFAAHTILTANANAILIVQPATIAGTVLADVNKDIMIHNPGTQCTTGTGTMDAKVTYRVHVTGL